jgi:serine/threonine protein kinase/Tfp pilus assembly protein PilF
VEALLKVHFEDENFLKSPPGVDGTLNTGQLSEGPGTKIGRYKLLQQIGEGGFGVVYMAEQEKPIRRRVALKIIKLGMDTKRVIARFEAERQALAMMGHPNIAKVLDAGATDTGRPYFVMELVRGIPITEYCDKNNLNTKKRLELFIDVCKAVQHAHQKGIIHRDIKPSNVLVTLRDDDAPVPKIIDFGIAKATQARLTEKTLFTEFKQFIGTPEYMSPEQARMGELDIDTRSDIYALGVLLYELLTDTTPFDREKLRSSAYDEMLKTIREAEPPKPSTRLNTLGDVLDEVARHRHIEPAQLCKIIKGDLDWIVLKALEKDRTRRYETANELAMDIERHLANEPVVAGPPSSLYRMKKFLRRNRALVTSIAVVLVVLVIGLSLATFGFIQASRERDLTHQARQRAEANFQMARDAVDEMAQVAEQKLAHAPGMEQVRSELLQKTQIFYERFLERNSGNPAAREEIGRAYERLGDIHFRTLRQYEQAAEAYQNALNVFVSLARDYHDVDNYARMIVGTTLEYSAALEQGGFYEKSPDTARTLTTALENLALQFPKQPLYRQRFVDDCDHWKTREDLEHAISLLENLLPEHPASRYELAKALNNLGHLLKNQGLQEQANLTYRRAEAVRAELVALLPDLPYENRRTCMPWAKSMMCSVEYKVRIKTAGHYQLFVRFDAHDWPSDSFYAWIEEFADGPGGTIPDWYTYGVPVPIWGGIRDADFATSAWKGSAMFETTWRRRNDMPATWFIPVPGDYTITFAAREDGAAVDAFVFQLAALPAPEAEGPAESERTKEMVFVESDGRVVVEAEHFASRNALSRDWRIVPDEDAGDTNHRNFRGNGYIQVLPDRTPYREPGIIWIMRGHMQSELGNWEQAIADYSMAIELNTNNWEGWFWRGHLYEKLGQRERASADYSRLTELQLGNLDIESFAWNIMLIEPEHLRNPAGAVKMATKTVEATPEVGSAWCSLGLAYYRNGQYEEALEALLKSIELQTTDRDAIFTKFLLSMVNHQLGQEQQANQCFEQAFDSMEQKIRDNDSFLWWFAEASELLEMKEQTMKNKKDVVAEETEDKEKNTQDSEEVKSNE